MSQFFHSNPSSQGPKRVRWSDELPRSWREGLGLPPYPPGHAAHEDGPSVRPAPAESREHAHD